MKEQARVSRKSWLDLYSAAVTFRRLECWEWMYDRDLFGVENPETGEVGYCCVLGNLGEMLALNVYEGPEGLNSYWRLHDRQTGSPDQGSLREAQALLSAQKCLMASFEDRSELDRQDLNQIRKLGLRFRGRTEWPMFRSFRPGFFPWFLTPPEVQFLTVALQQAVEVASDCRDYPDWFVPPDRDEGRYLVRVLGGGEWTNTWQQPAEYEEPEEAPVINEILLERLRQAGLPREGTWLTECILLPVTIEGGERPYYPYGLPVLTEDGMALGMELFKQGEVARELPNKFLELLQNVERLPMSLVVGNERTYDLLLPIAERLNIPLQQAESLPQLDFFLENMAEYLEGPE